MTRLRPSGPKIFSMVFSAGKPMGENMKFFCFGNGKNPIRAPFAEFHEVQRFLMSAFLPDEPSAEATFSINGAGRGDDEKSARTQHARASFINSDRTRQMFDDAVPRQHRRRRILTGSLSASARAFQMPFELSCFEQIQTPVKPEELERTNSLCAGYRASAHRPCPHPGRLGETVRVRAQRPLHFVGASLQAIDQFASFSAGHGKIDVVNAFRSAFNVRMTVSHESFSSYRAVAVS